MLTSARTEHASEDQAPARRVHLAVIDARYASAVLMGLKTIETRFTRTRRVPFGQVAAGERIYFIARKAGLIVTAVAARVKSYEDLTAARVEAIRREHGAAIGAPAEYWKDKGVCRFGTLLWLEGPELAAWAPDDVYGRESSYRSAWVIRPADQCVYPACCALDARRPDHGIDRQSTTILPNCSPASSLA